MGQAFDTFNQYAFGHYEGQIEDRNLADVVTRLIVDTGGVGYGRAVCDIDDRSAEVAKAGLIPNGITVRETVRDNNAEDQPGYPGAHEASVIRVGRIWVKAPGAAAKGTVYVTPDTGEITAASGGGALTFAGAKFLTDAGEGDMALVQLNGN
ncbi:structural cement protein Gp24 [Alloalcanivorax xenomutans]